MGNAGGVEIRSNSIRISFTVGGKAYKKTIKTAGKPIPPTPANIKHAHRLADEIHKKIRFGTFNMADFFPEDGTTGHATTVADRIDLWLGLQTGLAASSLKSYRVATNWWKDQIGHKPMAALVHSDILKALATQPNWSGKTRNGKVSVLRQAIQLALRDGVISSDPIDGLEPVKHQSPEPDPFPVEQVDLILRTLEERYGEEVANYFGVKFYTGLRTGESLGLRWSSIDWPSRRMTVKEGITMGEHVEVTKTRKIRQIHLNSKALAYLQRQKAYTLMHPGGWVFVDPKTRERWTDDWGPRNTYWEPTLKKLGLRYRSPYQTRHTYATMLLMSGTSAAWAARQMGHSVQMFHKTYARWIDGGQDLLELGKLEGLIGQTPSATAPKAA
jgi:integrase